jgi:hypothetical protein
MGFMVPNAVMDKDLEEVALSDRAFLCSQEPATYDEAATTYNLATINLTPGDGNGDWTIGDGDTAGRKLTLAEKTGTGVGTGTANHVAFAVTGAPGDLKFVSTLADFSVIAGVDFVLASRDIWEIEDPV